MSEKPTVVQMAPEPTYLKEVEPKVLFDRVRSTHKNIERRAFEIIENDG